MKPRLIYARWREFAATDRARRLLRAVRAGFVLAIVGVLIYQITKIGWTRILTSLPTQPAFYALLLAMYFMLPVTESLIYGRLWSLRPLECLGVMIRKRVLNVDVLGYSGELYLFLWAKDRVAAGSKEVMGIIKDNLIMSSVSSLLAAAMLLGGLLATGHLVLDEVVRTPSPFYAALAGLAAVFLGVVAYRFRREIFTLPRRILPLLAGAHVSRFLLGYVLQVAAWWVVIPTASFQTWALLLVAFVVINRIPFLPSSDLVFVSAGATLTPMLDVSVAPVVSMLLVRSAADRLLNLVLSTASVWWERHRVSTREDADVQADLLDGPDAPSDTQKTPEALNT